MYVAKSKNFGETCKEIYFYKEGCWRSGRQALFGDIGG